ncbi:hypothetical protein [Flavobacterium sp. ACN6]|uniref:hypothetical protein n=1 Tax=Flavobacterium sp. ACN6 TaxID=1920426 RepID=UPI000BB38021|nr:hypothetical protein [Flavobacterium sp. ACN6]PBJ15642.1 hypothetical protein BSF42_00440 [Flavobacterium sp. ACN6]
MKRLLLILSFLIYFNAKSQNTDAIDIVEDHSIATQLFTKCFENLNQGSEIFEKYPALKNVKFCTLINCMFLYAYKENDIQLAAEKRLIGIATQLYNEGNPVYLTMGLDSYLSTQEKNKNLEDDNHIVYISYGECTNPTFLIEAAKIVNKQTNLLINRSVSK